MAGMGETERVARMSSAPPLVREGPRRPRPLSFDEFLVQYAGQHAEWHPDGTVEIVVATHITHNRITRFLSTLLSLYLGFRPAGELLTAAYPQRVADYPARSPDLMIVGNERREAIRSDYLDGPADIAIEVVAPESAERDYSVKYREYEASGVLEYWLIDADRRVFDVHERGGDGRYQRRQLDTAQRVTSTLLPGFALDPRLLWSDPLPQGKDLLALVSQMSGVEISVRE
jgi:Uma2 family endonuclease